jgi:hypothetical protein
MYRTETHCVIYSCLSVQIGTGFTDAYLETHANFFKDHMTEKPKPYYRFDSSVEPDHWFDAVQVWEVKCADLSISPTHMAAAGIVSVDKSNLSISPTHMAAAGIVSVDTVTSPSPPPHMAAAGIVSVDRVKVSYQWPNLYEATLVNIIWLL